jgi:phosphate transport system substrate-binding protein
VQKLTLNQSALGIFGYSFLDQNSSKVSAHPVDGIAPTFETIASGDYPVARSLYVYTKRPHINIIEGLKPFLEELTSEMAISDEGYLALKGLIPYPFDKRQQTRTTIDTL